MYWVTTSYGNTISCAGIMCWITSCCINAQVYDTLHQNTVLEYNMLLWNIGKLLLELSKIVIPCIGMMHGGTTPCIGVVHWSMTTCIGVMHWSTTPCILAQHLALEWCIGAWHLALEWCIGVMHWATTPCMGMMPWSMTTCIGAMHWSMIPCIGAHHLTLEWCIGAQHLALEWCIGAWQRIGCTGAWYLALEWCTGVQPWCWIFLLDWTHYIGAMCMNRCKEKMWEILNSIRGLERCRNLVTIVSYRARCGNEWKSL